MRRAAALLLLVLTLLAACTPAKNIKTEQLSEFKKIIRKEYTEISDLKIQMAPTKIDFNYYLDKNTDEETSKQIFLQTKELVLTDEFRQTTMEKNYFKHYSKGEDQFPNYPHITIRFHISDKEEADYQYQAYYYGPGVNGVRDPDRPIDNYQTWFIDQFEGTPEKVEN